MLRFKELIELWRTANSLTRAFESSHVMLEITREMFTVSVQSLRQSDSADVGVDIYAMDQKINKYEQDVRRKVLKHLAITGGANIIPGLILTSIVIDIERIGDYTKNIKDLAAGHPNRLTGGRYHEDLVRIEAGVGEVYGKILPMLKSSDAVGAQKLMEGHWWILRKCDEIVNELIAAPDPELDATDAVATALYTRYLKRIAAHLMNIASSIFNPFERIGFRAEADDD
jgi:phosphate transport system protein